MPPVLGAVHRVSDDIEKLRTLSIGDSDRASVSGIGTRPGGWRMLAMIGVPLLVLNVAVLSYVAWTASRPAPQPKAVPVTAAPAAAQPPGTIVASGYVIATRRATVAAEVTGRLERIFVEEGDIVQTGQLLAVLDTRLANADVAAAEARTRASQASVEVLEADYAEAQAQFARARDLHGRGFLSDSAFTERRARMETLAAQIERAKADVGVSRAGARLTAAQRARYEIRAPFGGVVTSRNAQAGEVISPVSAGGGFTRTGVCTIVDMSSLVVDVDVSERLIGSIRPGQQVRLTLDAFPGKTYAGVVLGRMPTVMRERAAVTVRVRFLDRDSDIMPDMAARVTFLPDENEGPR